MKMLSLITYLMSFQTRKTIFGTQIKIFLVKSKSFLTLHRQQHNWNVSFARKKYSYIKNILIFVLKMNEGLTGLERHEGV